MRDRRIPGDRRRAAPDFAALVSLYPSFASFVTVPTGGRPSVDFAATRELTHVLLLDDHGPNCFRLLAPRRDGTAKSVLIEDGVGTTYPTTQFCGSFFVYQDTSPYVMDTHARSELFSAVLVTCTQGLCSMMLPTSKTWRPIMSLSFDIKLCSIEKAWVFLFHHFLDDYQNPMI